MPHVRASPEKQQSYRRAERKAQKLTAAIGGMRRDCGKYIDSP